jgi:hypothetical protein
VGEVFGAPAHRCEPGQQRFAPLVRPQVGRNGEHGAAVEVKSSLGVASGREQLHAATLRASHLGGLEHDFTSRDQREHGLGLVRDALRQAALEILEEGALRSATALFG